MSITELDGDDDQPAVRANTTLLVKLGNSYTYRVLFSDPDEGDNITLYLREEVPGASIEDGESLKMQINLYNFRQESLRREE